MNDFFSFGISQIWRCHLRRNYLQENATPVSPSLTTAQGGLPRDGEAAGGTPSTAHLQPTARWPSGQSSAGSNCFSIRVTRSHNVRDQQGTLRFVPPRSKEAWNRPGTGLKPNQAPHRPMASDGAHCVLGDLAADSPRRPEGQGLAAWALGPGGR